MKYDYPQIRKAKQLEDHFGISLEAPYTWLRDTADPEVLDFTSRENAFTDAYFDPDEIKAMIKKLKAEQIPELPSAIFPWHDGYIAGESHEGNYSIIELDSDFKKVRTLFRRYDLPERTAFSAVPCPLAEDLLDIMALQDGAARPDNIIYDYASKQILKILPMTFSGVWSKKHKAFYSPSTITDGNNSRTFIQKYDVGKNETSEVFSFEGNAIFGSTFVSEDGHSLLFAFSQDYSHDFFFLYDEEKDSVTPINDQEALMLSYIDSIGDRHYFVSFENDPHGQIIAIDQGKNVAEAEIIYEEKEAYIESGFSINGKLFLLLHKDAASILFDLENRKKIKTRDQVVALSPTGKSRNGYLLACDSFTSRPKILRFDGDKLQTLGGKEETDTGLVVELLKAPSIEDHKLIPYYLVRRKDAPKDGSNKTLIYGYGGYNAAMPPWSTEMVTQTNIRSWVEEGGIYVHCLLRGGNEYGTTWHEEGMGLKKKNCYYDFIGITKQLIAEKWTRPEKIAISGCSNGGLLMSALLTMRPDLFGCVIDSVPHTDMIHFADDDRGPMYITEYGDPYGSKEEFEYLLSYSPIHNVKDVEYPAVYIQTGECDNNVPPYHGKSFAATLQEHNQSDKPILLRVLKLGSHDRGQGEAFWQTIAEMHVFMNRNLK